MAHAPPGQYTAGRCFRHPGWTEVATWRPSPAGVQPYMKPVHSYLESDIKMAPPVNRKTAPLTAAPPAPAPAPQANNPMRDILTRLLRRERAEQFLQRMCAGTNAQVRISTVDNAPVLTAGTAPHSGPVPPTTATVPVRHGQQQVALVRATSSDHRARDTASMVALWLEELLSFEDEVSSLTQEVVHSYEELHLLYELGSALGGVLDMEETCAMVVQAVLDPLGAASSSLSLAQQDGSERLVAQASNSGCFLDDGNAYARASASLHVNGEPVGTLVVEGKLFEREFNSGDLKLLEGVAAVSAPAIRAAQLYQGARLQADTDGLTGLDNHRRIQERIDEEMERARQNGKPLTIMLVDLDNFKLFNDVYGHPVGDRVLKTVSQCLRQSVRGTDFVGRYGGDEFMLVLPGTDCEHAMEVADRVLTRVAECEIVVDGARLPLGTSLGVATFPQDAANKHELIAHVDSALYESKRCGGGTVRQAHAPRVDWLALQGNTFSTLEGLVQSVDAKDHYTRQHSEVVTEVALLLADQLNLSDETRRAVRIAGLLHDVGKIGIPDYVLKKPGKLTSEEYAIMQRHVHLSEMIIKDVPYLNDVLDAVAHHHERYDGMGYPYHKREEEIPLLGRIMAVADAYSAMCLDRPYRKALTWPEAREELLNGSGSQFDPRLVDLFIKAMEARATETQEDECL
jgi:diguanylate cyclase (GGDEF)-like protein/putative nucleotidyltransferase with HDIG domain